MARALSLARLALGQVSPNPAVGAVVVNRGQVVGQGFTQPPGDAHAEIVALTQAEGKTEGAKLYTTLEPCAHFGRTPPCTQAIIKAGIKEVHVASVDDNPQVGGKGIKELEKAGISVVFGEHEQEARQLNEAYIKFITTGMPFITAKYAMSLDGKTATYSGDSKWISNEEARDVSHGVRYMSDAIMAGLNTVLTDDPHLTARTGHGHGGTGKEQPVRVIIDDTGRVPLTANLLKEPGKTLIALATKASTEDKKAYADAGAELVEMPGEGGLVDLEGLLKNLAERDITSVLVEGGGVLLGSLFDLGLVDKVIAFVAPEIIGGKMARVPVVGEGVDKVADAIRLENIAVSTVGDNVMITGYVKKD